MFILCYFYTKQLIRDLKQTSKSVKLQFFYELYKLYQLYIEENIYIYFDSIALDLG